MGPVEKPPASAARRTARSIRRIAVQEIVGEGGEAILEHKGEDYRLRVTRNGKLILTKGA
ncbi:MAG: hemin uptake protein HemP [Alphaproteobacteria bacterium]|nr:hemin uptake protein HemP [Alphaproteobacteria bacterium]